MLCPNCGEENHRVLDTWILKDGTIRRVRKCCCCDYPWVTDERDASGRILAAKLEE